MKLLICSLWMKTNGMRKIYKQKNKIAVLVLLSILLVVLIGLTVYLLKSNKYKRFFIAKKNVL